jgi:hypothetical protein
MPNLVSSTAALSGYNTIVQILWKVKKDFYALKLCEFSVTPSYNLGWKEVQKTMPSCP